MLQRVRCHIPWYHDQLFESILQAKRGSSIETPDDVDRGIERLLRVNGSFLQHAYDRLSDHGAADAQGMKSLLLKIAKTETGSLRRTLGSVRDAVIDHQLDVLCDEGYLTPIVGDGGLRYAFLSPLVRLWWCRQ